MREFGMRNEENSTFRVPHSTFARVGNFARLSKVRTILRVGRRGDEMKLATVFSLACFLGLTVYGQQNASISGKILSRNVGLPGVRLVLEEWIVEAGKAPLR